MNTIAKTYKTQSGGSINYVGPRTEDNKDYTYDPDELDRLLDKGLYNEAISYIDSYSYTNPIDYAQMSQIRDECETNIMYKQRQYQLAGEDKKAELDFINMYNTDYNNLISINGNKYANEYLKLKSQLFDGEEKIELNFTKTKRKFIFDRLAADNTENNINAYKKRLAEKLGFDSVSDNYLKTKGIEVHYGDEDGAGRIVIDENSPYIKEILEAVNIDRFQPDVYSIDSKGNRKNKTSTNSSIYAPTYGFRSRLYDASEYNVLSRMHNLLDNVKRVENLANLNDDFVASSKNYPLVFPGSDELDARINAGGKEGSAASKMRQLYEKQLIGALRMSIPGMQDIRVFAGPKDVLSYDENNLAINDDKKQEKLLEYIGQVDDSDILVGLNITNDGRCGITFEVNGKAGSKNVKERERMLFTIYDWNVKEVKELMDNSPEYSAIMKANKISRYNSTYKALDGNYYTYIGGGYGDDAIYEDAYGNRMPVKKLYDVIMRDNLIKSQINSILARSNSVSGVFLNTLDELKDDMDASAILIGSKLLKSYPINSKGEPLSIKDIQAFINLDDNTAQYTSNNRLAAPSYEPLNEIRNIRILLYNRLMQYYEQNKR